MKRITSTRNPHIQAIRALQTRARARREQGAFVVEGVRLVEEALQSDWTPRLVIYEAGLGARGQAIVAQFAERKVAVAEVAPHVLLSASDTKTPQGLLAVLPIPEPVSPIEVGFALIVDSVRDPGNLGAILRTAAAAGVEVVFLAPGSVDPYAPKVVRAAMGAHFSLPLCIGSWEQIRAWLRREDPQVAPQVLLAAARAGQPYTQMDFRGPTALIVGGEAEGTSTQARSLADVRVHIPMPGGAESLNVAIASAILLFEVVRQRMGGSGLKH